LEMARLPKAPVLGMDHLPKEPTMDAAVVRIEANVGHLQGDVSETRSDVKEMRDHLARLEVNVEHLPSKGFMISIVLVLIFFALVTGVTLFQGKLLALLGAAH